MLLLEAKWLPVKDRHGTRHWISPDDLSRPDIVALDADRADFNGALVQFAIGLLQTTLPAEVTWESLFNQPPGAQTLRGWFAPVASFFEFGGKGARFMQDSQLSEGEPMDIGALLIDSPGENAVKNNSDHFVKRGRVQRMCPCCAATALLTLQINAPAGGVGYRTGLRGGGPLTTLLGCSPPRSLWHDLWLNIRERSVFLAEGCDATKTAPAFTFPWTTEQTSLQKQDGELAPIQVHPAHVFWAMPRRIWLDMDNVTVGICDICGRHDDLLIRHYRTKNYGLNYKGPWNHPLSPYYESKEGWLPLHPQPGGLGYRHWLSWVAGISGIKKKQRRARAVDHALMTLRSRHLGATLRLWAFGYDMDNMKARCWYESTLPLYGLAECDADTQQDVQADLGNVLGAAETTVFHLRSAVKAAWFGDDARGDFSNIDASFWSDTEAAFYRLLRLRIDAARAGVEFDFLNEHEAWLRILQNCARRLFDEVFVGSGPIDRQDPRRIATAHRQLINVMHGPKMRESLRLPVIDSDVAGKKSKTGRRGPSRTA